MGIFTRNQDSTEDGSTRVQFTTQSKQMNAAAPAAARAPAAKPSVAPPPAAEPKLARETPSAVKKNNTQKYGIDEAIELMRQMPEGNIEVIVTVVKKTLESTEIRIGDIIVDAEKKESEIRSRTKRLEAEIRDLEEKISHRNNEIAMLLTSLDETVQVREHLQIAEGQEKSVVQQTAQVDMRSIKPKQAAEEDVEFDAEFAFENDIDDV